MASPRLEPSGWLIIASIIREFLISVLLSFLIVTTTLRLFFPETWDGAVGLERLLIVTVLTTLGVFIAIGVVTALLHLVRRPGASESASASAVEAGAAGLDSYREKEETFESEVDPVPRKTPAS